MNYEAKASCFTASLLCTLCSVLTYELVLNQSDIPKMFIYWDLGFYNTYLLNYLLTNTPVNVYTTLYGGSLCLTLHCNFSFIKYSFKKID